MRRNLIFILTALLAGCAPTPRGEAVLRYERGQAPLLMPAPYDGEYRLYAGDDREPRARFDLHKGEHLGFRPGRPGRISAIAGDHDVDCDDTNLIWRRE